MFVASFFTFFFYICFQVSQDEAIKQKEILANELKCLREELKQIRDDRDCQLGQVHALTGEIAKYKEYTGKTCTQLDTLMIKTNALEVCCFVLLLPFIILFFYYINPLIYVMWGFFIGDLFITEGANTYHAAAVVC